VVSIEERFPRPSVMGVVNVTPDSFSDGGRYLDPDAAVAHALRLVADGADVLDVGGEATNPKAQAIDATEELRRVLPVVERLVAAGATVSIDTTKAEVARAAVAAGATYINDVSGGLFDPAMVVTTGELAATYICGHLRGRSIREVFTDENRPVTWVEVADELSARLAALPEAVRDRAWVDPGVGFGKGGDVATNVELLRRSGDLADRLGRPVVVGPSRKRFVAALARASTGTAPTELDLDRESVRLAVEAVRAGARMIRTHNVALLRDALTYNNM
jgi:dihydropteroate synthase